jgi:hypothetical protein
MRAQAECLRQPLVEAGCNLVFTAPTSAGKSMVADVLLLQLLMAQPDKAALMVRLLYGTFSLVLPVPFSSSSTSLLGSVHPTAPAVAGDSLAAPTHELCHAITLRRYAVTPCCCQVKSAPILCTEVFFCPHAR